MDEMGHLIRIWTLIQLLLLRSSYDCLPLPVLFLFLPLFGVAICESCVCSTLTFSHPRHRTWSPTNRSCRSYSLAPPKVTRHPTHLHEPSLSLPYHWQNMISIQLSLLDVPESSSVALTLPCLQGRPVVTPGLSSPDPVTTPSTHLPDVAKHSLSPDHPSPRP